MSRPKYPTRLRDHLGNEVRLPPRPFATGGEGAVFDVIGCPDLVAKLYSKPQSKERCDKLRAMAKLCSPDLRKIAAWPTATLSDGTTAIEGILMPRIADHKEIHQLYSVAQRKKDFPEADWGFLLHTARNCAIAFESIHGHGHVVGDVNQKNVMVSKKGIVALVDCDSFQVKEGNRIFRCGVGVPEYTPPELHGKRFTDLDRDANHDLFGLAVMVFHLLMMGRHPFAGVPHGNVDIPIEKAIQDGLYAYARNPSRLKPPPHVPPVAMLDALTRDLFERAFGSSRRPTATEWRGALDSSMKGLQRCKSDPKHSYPAAAGNCPWCQLIAVARLMFFIPGQVAAGATLRIEDFRKLVQKLAGMQLVFPSYTRPKPVLPIRVTLPSGLRVVLKPALLPYPAPPAPVQKPAMVSSPPPPIFPPRPMLRPLPPAPVIPVAPRIKPHPPAPIVQPRPNLHTKPPPPEYPPVPTPDPPDPFLPRLCIAAALTGLPVCFIAKPVGVIVMLAFGASWLLMKATEGIRREMNRKSLMKAHEVECSQFDEEYDELVRPIENANRKLLDAWESATAARAAEHARLCRAVDDENRRTIAPWEAVKAEIEADHRRATQEIEQANRHTMLTWEAQIVTRQASYDIARRDIERENQRLTAAWDALMASRQAEHHRNCSEIDAKNQQIIAAWEAANAPWIDEQKRWRDCATFAETEIKRLEGDFMAQRSAAVLRFQQRKLDADGLLKSHDGACQDYERELRQAEIDSKKIQLEEHLDKSLIRNAKLKGITGVRILELESFGVETARDVDILKSQKVPGIGPVLSNRLFEWRDKLASSFRPKQALPESEKNRIAVRYAPVLRPLAQTIQTAISDLESIAASHRARESECVRAIAEAVQNLAVAEAYVMAMKVV